MKTDQLRQPFDNANANSTGWSTSLAAWQAEAEAALTKSGRPNGLGEGEKWLQLSEQFMIVITCRDEKQQVEVLGRFQGEGLECKALVG